MTTLRQRIEEIEQSEAKAGFGAQGMRSNLYPTLVAALKEMDRLLQERLYGPAELESRWYEEAVSILRRMDEEVR